MAPLLATQPLKAIYTIYILLTIPVRAVYFYLRYLVKPLHPEWNANMSLLSAMLDVLFQYCLVTGSRHVLDNDPKTAKERFVEIDPPPQELFSGAIAATGIVKPAPVKGVWLPRVPPKHSAELKKEKVVLHFPGGAFVVTFGHEFSGRPAAEIFTKHLKASLVLWAHYRLSENDETRFPGAVQDAVTFYRHVISLGFEPENIIISGDSAGGNVALALLRYLEASKLPELPLPGGFIVFSPWVSVTTRAAAHYASCENQDSDILNGAFLQWGAESYLPSMERLPAEVEAYVSPIHHPFQTSVPVFIWAGAAEAFCADIKTFAKEMADTPGNKVRFYAQDRAAHDLLLNYHMFKLEEGFYASMRQACKFLHNAE
ncbi:hypothetical protein KVR01_009359 [Diaporthe batatas]|uniref:uncharacterized protein n=1 Tax=Diaporthe batatas TaxID=748121 RepID=UPI001D04A99D|nr:uncharacterized protein KVR01_009359 [Diaporthe batatas]KAG8161095.1 hypothetical protein KVR01_009359 [Diaporthe batatas]